MSTLNVSNLAGPSSTGTAATLSSLNGGPLSGTRNRIINGNFDVWQRGTATGSWVAPITSYYWPDRWVFTSGGTGGNGSVSRQAFTAGQTDVPGEPTYFMRWQITSAASGQTTGSCFVEQRIEDVRTLAGASATISFYAKGTGTLPNIYLSQTFGSGGSSQVTHLVASNIVLNTNWTKYTYTVNLSSISGKTIGTNHYVNLTFMVPLNSTYTLDLAQVQVEPGTIATPFERRSFGQELSLCERYYQIILAGVTQGGSTGGSSYTFATPYRVVPRTTGTSTISYTNVVYANASNIRCDAAGEYGLNTGWTASINGFAGVQYADIIINAEL